MKSAEEYSAQDILNWIGAGPKKEGIWHLTEAQAASFPEKNGVLHFPQGFRYTKWSLSAWGAIRWKPASRREWEAYKNRPDFDGYRKGEGPCEES